MIRQEVLISTESGHFRKMATLELERDVRSASHADMPKEIIGTLAALQPTEELQVRDRNVHMIFNNASSPVYKVTINPDTGSFSATTL
jgi:hypothetical protein